MAPRARRSDEASAKGQEGKKKESSTDQSIRTNVFYRSIETIRMCEPGGQLTDDSTADEHLSPGRSSLRNMVAARGVSPSAAAVYGNQPLVAAAALTMDRKDARRKDARRATRHYLDSHLLSQSRIESRGRTIPCAGWARHVNLEPGSSRRARVCARTRVYVPCVRDTGRDDSTIEPIGADRRGKSPGLLLARLTSGGITCAGPCGAVNGISKF